MGAVMKTINYKGQSVTTKNYVEMTDEDRLRLKQEYFTKPPFEDIKNQMKKINLDGTMNDKITNYYFKDLMAKVQVKTAKWTVEDLFENIELLGMFKAKTLNNKNVFPDTKPEIDNIMTAVRLGGKGYIKKPTKFPVKTVKFILNKYNVNNNYFDFSCGWGDRLVGALSKNVNYYGTDPNPVLCERLNELNTDWHSVISTCLSDVKIYNQGSEVFIPELENTIGLAFSSPPYFDLEDYVLGNQSWRPGVSYEDWKNNYLIPTFENIKKYLIKDGYLALNIKNVDNYPIVTDCYDILTSLNFKYMGVETLENNNRITPNSLLNTNEGIFIYQVED